MSVPPRATVVEVLACFGTDFASMAASFARGEYLLWLGSGISRDVVPDVRIMIRRLLEFLQAKADPTDPNCRFEKALGEVLDVAGIPAPRRELIDLAEDVSAWPDLDDTLDRLIDRYSDVLGVHVQGEAADFLVWDGLDVPTTYGSASLEPDVEHLCIAILMLEGLVRSAPTTNWDGLVERAMEQVSGGRQRLLNVVVRSSDFTAPACRAELLKFHGCAVRAAVDPGEYRHRLIARRTQIDSWLSNVENQMMRNHLENLFASRPALILGLSAQDANIHAMLHRAREGHARIWPAEPPAVVFAEQTLHRHHRAVLGATYGDDAYAASSQPIETSALLGAYAKPALVALVLFGLADKLCALIAPEGLALNSDDIERLRADIRRLRDTVGGYAHEDLRLFVDSLVSSVALVMSVFRAGAIPGGSPGSYEPLSVAPVAESLADPDFPVAALGRLALVVALLGRGLSEGLWTLVSGSMESPGDGVLRVATTKQNSHVFVVRNARAHSQLELGGVLDPNDSGALVLLTEAAKSPATRSPRGHYGRTGRRGLRLLDLEAMCATVETADELFEAFRLEGAL